jgi:hypothetical protein
MSKIVWRIADYLVPAAGIYGVCVIFGLTGLPYDTGHAIVICSSLYVVFRWLLPVLVGRGRPVGQMPRPAAQPVAEDECTGWIGWVRFQYPNLHVAVYEDRFVIETVFAEHTIMYHEIASIDNSEHFQIYIWHRDQLTKSPIRLSLARYHVVRDAIAALVED